MWFAFGKITCILIDVFSPVHTYEHVGAPHCPYLTGAILRSSFAQESPRFAFPLRNLKIIVAKCKLIYKIININNILTIYVACNSIK